MTLETIVDGHELIGCAPWDRHSVTVPPFVVQFLVAMALTADGTQEGFHDGVVHIDAASAWHHGKSDEEFLDRGPIEWANDIQQKQMFVVGDDNALGAGEPYYVGWSAWHQAAPASRWAATACGVKAT
jgi:hypothetical protein